MVTRSDRVVILCRISKVEKLRFYGWTAFRMLSTIIFFSFPTFVDPLPVFLAYSVYSKL